MSALRPTSGRRGILAASAAVATVAVAAVAAGPGGTAAGAGAPASSVKPLDHNVWIVRGPIDPDRQRFCSRSIASIVPAQGDITYVLCDTAGRERTSRRSR